MGRRSFRVATHCDVWHWKRPFEWQVVSWPDPNGALLMDRAASLNASFGPITNAVTLADSVAAEAVDIGANSGAYVRLRRVPLVDD